MNINVNDDTTSEDCIPGDLINELPRMLNNRKRKNQEYINYFLNSRNNMFSLCSMGHPFCDCARQPWMSSSSSLPGALVLDHHHHVINSMRYYNNNNYMRDYLRLLLIGLPVSAPLLIHIDQELIFAIDMIKKLPRGDLKSLCRYLMDLISEVVNRLIPYGNDEDLIKNLRDHLQLLRKAYLAVALEDNDLNPLKHSQGTRFSKRKRLSELQQEDEMKQKATRDHQGDDGSSYSAGRGLFSTRRFMEILGEEDVSHDAIARINRAKGQFEVFIHNNYIVSCIYII